MKRILVLALVMGVLMSACGAAPGLEVTGPSKESTAGTTEGTVPHTEETTAEAEPSQPAESVTTEPDQTKPVITEPAVTEPEVTEPSVTEPTVTVPDPTEPAIHVHSYVANVHRPTCTEGGCTVYTCSGCGNAYTDEQKPAAGHDYASTVTAPSCILGGYTLHTCKTCGNQYTDSAVPAAGHSYTELLIAPTCTQGGQTRYTCTVCGSSYSDRHTAAAGHSWGSWAVIKEPAYTEYGMQERACAVCGQTQSQSIAPLVMSESQMQQEVLRLVNIEREKAGVAPMVYLTAGQTAADIRAQEIQESFSHTRPNGSSCFTVLDENQISYRTAGENIAYGYATPEEVVNGWMNSEGHRNNILNANFTSLVVGVKDRHWVQLFVG